MVRRNKYKVSVAVSFQNKTILLKLKKGNIRISNKLKLEKLILEVLILFSWPSTVSRVDRR
jgi:hypothetical protein